MKLNCPLCNKEFTLTSEQKFNYIHKITINPTCGARCKRLHRIKIESDKNRFMIINRKTKKRVSCRKYFKTQTEARLAIKKLDMWDYWMSSKLNTYF